MNFAPNLTRVYSPVAFAKKHDIMLACFGIERNTVGGFVSFSPPPGLCILAHCNNKTVLVKQKKMYFSRVVNFFEMNTIQFYRIRVFYLKLQSY